eukprot:COSAG01_NODE_15264_length_1356_cov_1.302307_2_plen_208_part_01
MPPGLSSAVQTAISLLCLLLVGTTGQRQQQRSGTTPDPYGDALQLMSASMPRGESPLQWMAEQLQRSREDGGYTRAATTSAAGAELTRPVRTTKMLHDQHALHHLASRSPTLEAFLSSLVAGDANMIALAESWGSAPLYVPRTPEHYWPRPISNDDVAALLLPPASDGANQAVATDSLNHHATENRKEFHEPLYLAMGRMELVPPPPF